MFPILNLAAGVFTLGLSITWYFIEQYVLFASKWYYEYTVTGLTGFRSMDLTDLYVWYWIGLGCIIALAVLTILLIRSNITARSKKLQKNTSEEIAALPAKTSIVSVQKRKVIRLHLK